MIDSVAETSWELLAEERGEIAIGIICEINPGMWTLESGKRYVSGYLPHFFKAKTNAAY